MDRDVSGITLNFLRHVHNGFGIAIFFVEFFKFWVFLHGPIDGHGESLGAERNKFSYFIAQGIGKAQGPRHITYSPASHHSAESANLRDVIYAIFLASVFNQLISSIICNIKVKIRR